MPRSKIPEHMLPPQIQAILKGSRLSFKTLTVVIPETVLGIEHRFIFTPKTVRYVAMVGTRTNVIQNTTSRNGTSPVRYIGSHGLAPEHATEVSVVEKKQKNPIILYSEHPPKAYYNNNDKPKPKPKPGVRVASNNVQKKMKRLLKRQRAMAVKRRKRQTIFRRLTKMRPPNVINLTNNVSNVINLTKN
jgi:hypothetical protein